jgi:hypothetical protein
MSVKSLVAMVYVVHSEASITLDAAILQHACLLEGKEWSLVGFIGNGYSRSWWTASIPDSGRRGVGVSPSPPEWKI